MGSDCGAAHLCVAKLLGGIPSWFALMRHKPDFMAELQNLAEIFSTLPTPSGMMNLNKRDLDR